MDRDVCERADRRRFRRLALLLVGGGVSISLLFWAKLRVVTNIPKTTYAEPAEGQGEESSQVEPVEEPAPRDGGG